MEGKAPGKKAQDDSTRSGTPACGSAPRRTRTYNPLIKSQTSEAHKPQCGKGLRISTPPVSHHIPTDTCQNDPDLAAVVDAWQTLPEALKAGILAMVKAAGSK
jgi:hypothetical protein